MNLPQPPQKDSRPSVASKGALVLMAVIVGAMVLLALYVNVQHWRRDKIENVIVTPVTSPSPTAP